MNGTRSRWPTIKTPLNARGYAKKEKVGLDPQKEIIRRSLYPSNLRNRPTPTGGWRSDVGRAIRHAIPSVQAHDTIERAWLLHKRHLRKRSELELERKFECMRKAMDELHRVDPALYLEANKPENLRLRPDREKELLKTLSSAELRAVNARIRGLFPREMKIPTDTPSRSGWNYEWTPFPRLL
jgi:large subunit ribosomal protein L40